MKLFYYKDEFGNVGDDLNLWLWPKIFPGLLDNDESEIFVGIGTILNDKLPVTPVKHIFGSGFGYGCLPEIDFNYKIHAVRGPLTAKKLRIPAELAITDPAILLNVYRPQTSEVVPGRIGFVPHHESNKIFDWECLCNDLGLQFIDVSLDVDEFTKILTSCESVLCEAMHAAIFADALRVPWSVVICYDHINRFKWKDWTLSLNLDFYVQEIPSIYDFDRNLNFPDLTKQNIKRVLKKVGFYSSQWDQPLIRNSSLRDVDKAKSLLLQYTKGEFFLSKDRVFNDLIDRYQELISDFKRDYA